MKRKIFLSGFIICLSVILFACQQGENKDQNEVNNDVNNEVNEEEEDEFGTNEQVIRETAEDFIYQLYDLQHEDIKLEEHEEIATYKEPFEQYLTEEEFEKIYPTILYFPARLADNLEMDLVVNDLETTKEDSTDGVGLFKLSFEFRLDIVDDEKVFDEADIVGDMTLEHQADGSYKISRYYERGLQELLNKYLIEENEE